MGRGSPWLQDAAFKIGPDLRAVASNTCYSGASCFERRPDVRFCGTSLQLTNRLKPRFPRKHDR